MEGESFVKYSQLLDLLLWFVHIKMFTSFYSEHSGLVDESQCRLCSPGSYCSETGLSAASGPCLPGMELRMQSPVFYCDILFIVLWTSRLYKEFWSIVAL